jgi:undecaprenyl-diphosphatase
MDMLSLDAQVLLVVNQAAANALFDILMPALSQRGYLLVLPFLVLMAARSSLLRDPAGRSFLPLALGTLLVAIIAVWGAEWTEGVLKTAVARPRPCRVVEGLRLIVACPRSYSMPSGHAITSFAGAMPLYLLTRGYVTPVWRLYPLLLAAAIALSRLYLGVHYPSDVLAGALLGAMIGSALSFLLLWIRTAGTPGRQRH